MKAIDPARFMLGLVKEEYLERLGELAVLAKDSIDVGTFADPEAKIPIDVTPVDVTPVLESIVSRAEKVTEMAFDSLQANGWVVTSDAQGPPESPQMDGDSQEVIQAGATAALTESVRHGLQAMESHQQTAIGLIQNAVYAALGEIRAGLGADRGRDAGAGESPATSPLGYGTGEANTGGNTDE